MSRKASLLIAGQYWQSTFKSPSFYGIFIVMLLLLGYAGYSGWRNYTQQNGIRIAYQNEVRKSWENNPDKHPHRMAHYGSFAFRLKHPLSLFDFGLESFTGNAVFLEAHKQNSVNFSEASFSTGLLRFGEISMAMLLQVILPLIIFFLGFASVSSEREDGTLRVLLTQGASWKDILIGKSLGLMGFALLIFLPAAICSLILLYGTPQTVITTDVLLRYTTIMLCYLLFLQVVSIIAVLISASSRSSKESLMKLLALWLVLVIIMPKTTQALGSYFYPSPSKIQFESAIEEELIEEGDSHNPDDLHYKALKDSVLLVHQVDSVKHLPFNYSGFVMREGERMSTKIYKRHLSDLLHTYKNQNSMTRMTAFINPYVAIRNISMALTGTGFDSYVAFQEQAEAYRYQLAQGMNELQMKLISNENPEPDDKPHSISNDHWKEFPDFNYQFITTSRALQTEIVSIMALLAWGVVSIGLLGYLSRKAKTI